MSRFQIVLALLGLSFFMSPASRAVNSSRMQSGGILIIDSGGACINSLSTGMSIEEILKKNPHLAGGTDQVSVGRTRVDLPADPSQLFRVEMSEAFEVEITDSDSAESYIEVLVYSDKDAAPWIEKVRLQPSDPGIFKLEADVRSSVFQLIMINDKVLRISGTYARAKVYLSPQAQIKVYQTGSLIGRSSSAPVELEDVQAAVSDGNSSRIVSTLQGYLAQPEAVLETKLIVDIFAQLNGSDYTKVAQLIGLRANGLTIKQFLTIADSAHSDSGRLALVKAFANAISMMPSELVELIGQFSSPSSQAEAVRALASSVPLTGAQVPSLIEQVSSPSSILEIIGAIGPMLTDFNERHLKNILEGISSETAKGEAIQALHERLEEVSAAGLALILEQISSSTVQLKAVEVLHEKVRSVTAKGLESILDQVSSSTTRNGIFKLLLSKVADSELPAVSRYVEEEFSGSSKREALALLNARRPQ